MYYFIYNGETWTYNPNNPVILGTNESGDMIFGPPLKTYLGMTEQEAEQAHIEGLKNEIRPERNRLLSECDWVVAKYTELGEPIPQEWTQYRQALRDFTDNPEMELHDNGSLLRANWPSPPSSV